MPNPTPQVIKVKKPLILTGHGVTIGILSGRVFTAAGDLTPQIPAYEVPPPLILRAAPLRSHDPLVYRSIVVGQEDFEARIHEKPVWMANFPGGLAPPPPAGEYRPPLNYQNQLDDYYLAGLNPEPVMITRGVVPTPAPVGAPRSFLATVMPQDITPLLIVQPLIIDVTPIGGPPDECPGPPPRVDEGCVHLARVDVCCE